MMRQRLALLVVALLALQTTAGTDLHAHRGPQEPHESSVSDNKEAIEAALPAVVAIRSETPEGINSGSGFIVSSDGLVVTNLHVIRNALNIAIRLSTGEVFRLVKVIGYDEDRDIALLKFPAVNLHTLLLGNSDQVQPGTRVICIGNPKDLEGSVTAGIVSGIRILDSGVKAIQTDAAASPGSSGSALLNESGEVIGLVTFRREGGDSLNFAVPSNYVQALIDFDARALTLEEFREQLSNTKDLFAKDVEHGVTGTWKWLATGNSVTLSDSGDFIYGEILPLVESARTLTLELESQSDGTYRGKARGVWDCTYTDYWPSPRDYTKSCMGEDEIVISKISQDRIEGQAFYAEVPSPGTKAFSRFCKQCGSSATRIAHDFTLIRMK